MLGDACRLLRRPWPAERAVFKTLVKEQKTIALPQEALDPVAAFATEQEQDVFIKWSQMEVPFNDLG